MKAGEINAPVTSVAGVGPSTAGLLAKLNIFTVGQLLKFYPRSYEDRTRRISIAEAEAGGKIHTAALVTAHEWFGYGRMRTLKLLINDGSGAAELIAFNRSFLEKTLPPGTFISVTGTFTAKYGRLQSTSFEAEKIDAGAVPFTPDGIPDLAAAELADSKIYPIYPLTEGLAQKTLRKAVCGALNGWCRGIDDEIPPEIIERRGLLHKQTALELIHCPKSMRDAEDARRTIIYEELYHLQHTVISRSLRRRGTSPRLQTDSGSGDCDRQERQAADSAPDYPEFEKSLSPLQKEFLRKLPFRLTGDQCAVIMEMDSEIDRGYLERNAAILAADSENPGQNGIRPPFTMARLLQGDVGSGKTLTALMVCLRVISWKGQCAVMAPTEILARQHAGTIASLLDGMGVRTAFLTGNLKSSGRAHLLRALKSGEIDIVVGTHALFSPMTAYNDLQLAVIDEQHRFGVLQRQAILEKGRISAKNGITFEPHLLMMSATPIPQTLALTVFGDLDISTIRTMPAGRKPIKTYLIREGNEKNAYEAVRAELRLGHQAYFVYPAINSADDGDGENSRRLKSAEQMFSFLAERIYPEFTCALIHSKIGEDEQNRILDEFRAGKIQVLAATTVIEVGVDVPNATCMVIEQADRFGTAQLHQLRGRTGRGDAQSFCFLIYSRNITETGIARMKALRESTDGFYIAEQDLKTRGPGELTGIMQSGSMELGIADLERDGGILAQAREDAFRILAGQDRRNTNQV